MTEPSVDFLLHLNEASFKVPLELYKRNLKEINRINEKEIGSVTAELAEVDEAETVKDKLESLEALIGGLESYQTKLEECIEFEEDYNRRLDRRIDKLYQLDEFKKGNFSFGVSFNKKNFLVNKILDPQTSKRNSNTDSDVAVTIDNNMYLNSWFKDQVNVLIAQCLLKMSDFSDLPLDFFIKPVNFRNVDANTQEIAEYVKSKPALLYLHNFDNADFVDYDLIIRSNLISQDILSNKCGKNLLGIWIKENEKFLKKIQSSLKFELLLSNFVELIKDNVLKNENYLDLTNLSHLSKEENNFLDALMYMKTEILKVDRSEHNKYIDEIKTAMGLLTMPSKFILLFLKYEKFLIKHYYKHRYALNNLNSSFYSELQYTDFKMLVNKDVFIKFLNQFPGSKQLKLTNKKYLLNKNLTKYYKLLSFKRFNYLNTLFADNYNQLYSINNNGSSFELLLSLGLSVLKTRNCIQPKELRKISSLSIFETLNLNIEQNDTHKRKAMAKTSHNNKMQERLIKIKSKSCAICSSIQLIKLSHDLVFSHHSKSKLDYKTPIILPNNNIYDRDDLLKFNEALLAAFKNYWDHNKSEKTPKSLDHSHKELIDDYLLFYTAFEDYMKVTPHPSMEDFELIVDPVSGGIFNEGQCNIKVFPT